MSVNILLYQFPVEKKFVIRQIRNQISILIHLHQTVPCTIPSIRILVCIESKLRLCIIIGSFYGNGCFGNNLNFHRFLSGNGSGFRRFFQFLLGNIILPRPLFLLFFLFNVFSNLTYKTIQHCRMGRNQKICVSISVWLNSFCPLFIFYRKSPIV